jgi:hypothetical protein
MPPPGGTPVVDGAIGSERNSRSWSNFEQSRGPAPEKTFKPIPLQNAFDDMNRTVIPAN